METVVRGGNNGDLGFVLATFPRSLRYHSKFWEGTENSKFHKMTFNLLQQMLLKPSISLRILSDAAEPTLILAYAIVCLEEPNRALIYAYTKPAFRKQGYLRKLVSDLNLSQVAYVTKIMDRTRIRNKLELNPWVILNVLTKET